MMKMIPVAIPLHGKMIYRSLHSLHLRQVFSSFNLSPIFYVEKSALPGDDDHYEELHLEKYQQMLLNPLISISRQIRWFMIRTQSTESRFRNLISDIIWNTENLNVTLLKALVLNNFRYLKFAGPPLIWAETKLTKTDHHVSSWRKKNITRVLVSGVGNWDTETGCFFAREAQRQNIPVISTITNYDNLLSKGFRGFSPDLLTIWSQKMEKQAVELMGITQNKIVITGPTVFDRYFMPLIETRHEFLTRRGLDPLKKTIFYGGHTSIVTYFDFLSHVINLRKPGGVLADCNLIIRPYPNPKVLNWTGIKFFRDKIAELPNVYISDPLENSSDTFTKFTGEATDTSADELHAILKYSDLMINYFSTLGLEAAICDLPTIHIGYDKFTYQISPMAWSSTGARNAHNQDAQRRAASIVVTSDAELVSAIETYLNHHDLHYEERIAYAYSECEYLDGKATQRLAEAVASVA